MPRLLADAEGGSGEPAGAEGALVQPVDGRIIGRRLHGDGQGKLGHNEKLAGQKAREFGGPASGRRDGACAEAQRVRSSSLKPKAHKSLTRKAGG